MHHIVITLRVGPFIDSLCMKPTKNMDEPRERVVEFMRVENMQEY